ncbi:MAG: hypothetical protein PWQ08_1198 [Clostridiales bacterium]|nr:hypothetical protein [Clostridiales bacterium]
MKKKILEKYKQNRILWNAIAIFLVVVLVEIFIYYAVIAPRSVSVVQQTEDEISLYSGILLEKDMRLEQEFFSADPIKGGSILIGTYGLEGQQGLLFIALKDAQTNKTFETTTVDLSETEDNSFVNFEFNNAYKAENGQYQIEILASYLPSESRFWVWFAENNEGNLLAKKAILVDGQKQDGVLDFYPLIEVSFLTPLYWCIAVALLCFIEMLYIFSRKWEVHNLFLFSALILGLLYMVVYPPYGAHDEAVHIPATFARATAWQNGKWDFDPNEEIAIRKSETRLGYIASRADENQYYYFTETLLERGNSDYIDITTKSAGFSYEYTPQICGVLIARELNLGQTQTLYLAQIVALLVYTAIAYWAVRFSPFQELFALIALFPMTLRYSGSFSYDGFINAIALLYVALIFRLIYKVEKVTVKNFIPVLLFAVILAPCKVIYVPLCLLLFLIPKEKLQKKYLWGGFCATFSLSSVAVFAMNFNQLSQRVVQDGVGIGPWANEVYTIPLLLQQPLEAIRLFVSSSIENPVTLIFSSVTSIQHAGIPLIVSVFFIIIVCINVSQERMNKIPTAHKWMFAFIIVAVQSLGYLAAVTWTTVGSYSIMGMQGRYLIPVLPLFFLLLSHKLRFKAEAKNLLFVSGLINSYVILFIFVKTVF